MAVLEQGPPIEDDEEDYDEEEQPLSEDIDDDEDDKAGPSAAAGTRVGASQARHTLALQTPREHIGHCSAVQRLLPSPLQSVDIHSHNKAQSVMQQGLVGCALSRQAHDKL